jgi:alkanesulfonate monooxygenase SsuD/methylene tetrahydromethanopterin reductase-like flavin-dependent oxidoreductase (luciferase family)
VKFGVFDHVDRNALPLADFYQQRLDVVELYDRAGFYSYHVAEHHGTPLGMAPSPSVYLSAVARHTKRLRFGPLVYLLPLYHPVRLAEEIGMLDHLGRGRLDVGVGRGRSPIELASYGVEMETADALFDEAFEVLRGGLVDGVVSHAGTHFTFDNVPVATRPLQSPHPPFWYGIGSPGSAERCVARDFNVVTLVEVPAAAEIAKRFRAAATAAGKDLLMGICRFCVVADTTPEALAIARRAYRVWYKSFNHLFELHGIRPNRPWPNEFDAMAAAGLAFAGSPEQIADVIRSQVTAVGANYFGGQFVFGDMSFDESRRSIDLFAGNVIPAIQGQLSPA